VQFRQRTGIVDIQVIRAALHKQPFEPFMIRLADGRSPPVLHPDFVVVGKRRIFVVGEDDSTSTIEPLLVVSLDTPLRREKGGNGQSRKRG
jgi:hypothetical protein